MALPISSDRNWIPSSLHTASSWPFATATTQDERVEGELPAGFPKSINTPMVWTGDDFKDAEGHNGYTLVLSDAHIKELEEACCEFEDRKLPFEVVSRVTFPLPTLSAELKVLARQLTSGVGFFRIRGLDPKRYSARTNVFLYLGIASYIGTKFGRQDELGNMLLHLTDVGSEVAPGNVRQAPYSNVAQPFHTDASDIISLYSLGEAETGGDSQLVSTAMIYNEIVRNRPDIIKLLSSPTWVFDRFGLSPPYKERAVLYPLGEDKVQLSFSRRPLFGNDSSPRTPDIPELSAAHVEAINAIHFAAEKHGLSMKLKSGDLLFWNNVALLHARTGFTDSAEKRRHLIRLWLRDEQVTEQWPIPDELQATWSEGFDHAGQKQLWPIKPIRELQYVINQQRSSGHA